MLNSNKLRFNKKPNQTNFEKNPKQIRFWFAVSDNKI